MTEFSRPDLSGLASPALFLYNKCSKARDVIHHHITFYRNTRFRSTLVAPAFSAGKVNARAERPPPAEPQVAAPTSGLGLVQGELETLENLADRVTSADSTLEKIVLKAEYDTHLARIRRIVVAAEESERVVLDASLRRRSLGLGVEAMVGNATLETTSVEAKTPDAPVAAPVSRDLGSLFNAGAPVSATGTVIDVQV